MQGQTETVAQWGERWLTEWVADAPAQDRESRQWIADGWRRGVTLNDVIGWWRDDARFDEHNAARRAADATLLYEATRNGMAMWRLYRAARSEAQAIPEAVLAALDRWALRLESARGAQAIARALDLAAPRGGAGGVAALRKAERSRSIAADVHMLLKLGVKPAAAYRRVASERRMSAGAVKRLWLAWLPSVKPAGPGRPGDLEAAVRRMQQVHKLAR